MFGCQMKSLYFGLDCKKNHVPKIDSAKEKLIYQSKQKLFEWVCINETEKEL